MLSQPSVSLQIQALERELGVRLFERRGPKISLTPDGKLLFELAAPLVDNFDALRDSFAARRGVVRPGSLDIAAGESTLLYVLPRIVRRFCRACPEIDVKLHNVTGRDGLAMLRRGDADFAVGSMLDVPDDIVYHPVLTYDPILIAARRHPLAAMKRVTLRAIARYPLILPPRDLTTTPIVDLAFKQRGLRYRVRLEVGGWEVIKRYVELGLGVSIVTSVCLTGRERLAAIPLHDGFPQRTYGVVLRRGRSLSPQARRFVSLLDPTYDSSTLVPHSVS